MTGFEARAEAIGNHGKFLSGQLGSELQQAVDASHVSLGADVMGVICQVYAGIFNDELDHAKELLAKLPEVMETTGEGLSANAETYRNAEEANRASFGGN